MHSTKQKHIRDTTMIGMSNVNTNTWWVHYATGHDALEIIRITKNNTAIPESV